MSKQYNLFTILKAKTDNHIIHFEILDETMSPLFVNFATAIDNYFKKLNFENVRNANNIAHDNSYYNEILWYGRTQKSYLDFKIRDNYTQQLQHCLEDIKDYNSSKQLSLLATNLLISLHFYD